MINPEFTIQVDDRRLTLHLEALPRALKIALRQRIEALAATLLAQVRAAEPVRTGRLRAATHSFLTERETSIRGGVIIAARTAGEAHNVAAAALEYGVHRSVNVRAHAARLTHLFGHAATRQTVMIRAHPRRVDIAERRFLRGPAAAIRGHAIAELQAAITEAIEKTQRS
jgi:hypothetical protein